MTRTLTALIGAAMTVAALQAAAASAEEVIVVDAPDVQKMDGVTTGFLTSEVIGTDVYSNRGKRIGEVEDFVFREGSLYAVVDIQGSPIERYVDINDDQMVVIPWDQLRVQEKPS